MPMKYQPGGKVSGTGGQDWGGMGVDLTAGAEGTSHGPNTKLDSPPGGHGSKGSKSDSSPS